MPACTTADSTEENGKLLVVTQICAQVARMGS